MRVCVCERESLQHDVCVCVCVCVCVVSKYICHSCACVEYVLLKLPNCNSIEGATNGKKNSHRKYILSRGSSNLKMIKCWYFASYFQLNLSI